MGVVVLEQDAREALNGAQRRPEIVRHRVGEGLQLRVDPLKRLGALRDLRFEVVVRARHLLGHRVERPCQPAELVVASRGHALFQVARRDCFRGVGDPDQRRRQAPAPPPRSHDADENDERGDRRHAEEITTLGCLEQGGEYTVGELQALVGERTGRLADFAVADRELRDRHREQQRGDEQGELALNRLLHRASRTSRTLRVIASVVKGFAR